MLNLRKIRILSLLLFLTSFIAIIGTLSISNFLVFYKISFPNYPFKNTELKPIPCNEKNDFCLKLRGLKKKKSEQLDDCKKEEFIFNVHYKGERLTQEQFFNTYFKDEKYIGNTKDDVSMRFYRKAKERENRFCILNYSLINKSYSYFPGFFNQLTKITDILKDEKKYRAGHSKIVFPYYDGKTSISNIAKRYPINYFFKFLLFISSILMFLYWRSYNQIINNISQVKKINIFYIAGVLSSLALFLHILFLGSTIEIKNFQNIRRLILILFVFFEIIAQFNLIINLYHYEKKLSKYINNLFLEFKKYLIIIIILFLLIVLFFFSIFETSNIFINIVEWNFFTILIFFYLFSYFMWKKIN